MATVCQVRVSGFPYSFDEYAVKRKIAELVHSEDFPKRRPDVQEDESIADRLINFRVKLNESKMGRAFSDGSCIVTFPSKVIAQDFFHYVIDKKPRIGSNGQRRRLYVEKVYGTEDEDRQAFRIVRTVEKTPFIPPEIDEEHFKKQRAVDDQDLRVDELEIGVIYQKTYPADDASPAPRLFAAEWSRDCKGNSGAWLSFVYAHKYICIKLGDPLDGQIISIPFSSIQQVYVGNDIKPFVLFELFNAPNFQAGAWDRPYGDNFSDGDGKYRRRIGSLDASHEKIAPYAHHIRVTLYDETHLETFKHLSELCSVIPKLVEGPSSLQCHGAIFLNGKQIANLESWFKKVGWWTAFQIELLLRNGYLTTHDLSPSNPLFQEINNLCAEHPTQDSTYVPDLLRIYSEAMKSRSPYESPLACFQRIRDQFLGVVSECPPGNFQCCHITFTPTKALLEGPYPIQGNRIIRRYRGCEENFVRVDFLDEDKLRYRWQREVNGEGFLQDRVGGLLRNGFKLGGEEFNFLAYSSSALREHSVWFMRSFDWEDPEDGSTIRITPSYIRDSIGDFQGEILRQPSKYAARLALAFTATDPSVRIWRHQWEILDDIVDSTKNQNQFTDGCGTISNQLAEEIWEALGKKEIKPFAYQIRFLGFKGIVYVDTNLDDHPKSYKMRLRDSMEKFKSREADAEWAEIEIARAFDYPGISYLNRPMVMLLEGLGIKRDAFLRLQDEAVAKACLLDESFEDFRDTLKSHNFGRVYRLESILQKLESLRLDLIASNRIACADSPFLKRLRSVAKTSILRDIKHRAHIPIPKSYHLVGVADNGPTYVEELEDHQKKDVYVLPEAHICVCIQKSAEEEPVWIKGSCLISRSPVLHPGDVQRVMAIGEPPRDKICSFRNLRNAVVFPSTGKRALASCLAGGDLDGDEFDVVLQETLLPSQHEKAASYSSQGIRTQEEDVTIDDICSFVVEYMQNDVVALIGDRHLIIADQSRDGIRDKKCLKLAGMASKAVDYMKHGNKVEIDNIPPTLIRPKPDWHSAEVVDPRRSDFYYSDRALGYMYRAIELDDVEDFAKIEPIGQPLSDPISLKLRPRIRQTLGSDSVVETEEMAKLFRRYADELKYVAATHTLSHEPGARLLEEEIVIGTILAKCVQNRARSGRMYRMRTHTRNIVEGVKRYLRPNNKDHADTTEWTASLQKGWDAWNFSQKCCDASGMPEFGSHSFGLIALDVMFDAMEKLHAL